MKSIKSIVLSTAAIAVMAGTVSAAEFKVNGDIQFRLREETKIVLDSTNSYYEDQTSHIYANKYMWNLKLGVDVNENLGFKFRLSNPVGSALQTVTNNESITNDNRIVTIPQAEMQYTAGKFNLSAGIIAVKSTTPLTLSTSAERSGYTSGMDMSSTWGVFRNNSQAGLRVGYDFSDNVSLNVVSAIAEADYSDPAYVDFRTIVDAPIKINGDIKVTPSVAIRSGISGDYNDRKYNTNAGLDFSAKLSDAFSLAVGAAYGQFRDAEVLNDDNKLEGERTKSKNWDAPQGFLLSAKPTFKLGAAKLTTAYSFGTSSDRDATGDAEYSMYFQHVDLRLGLSIADNFTIMPRYRVWYNSDSMTDSDSKLILRPELIFIAKF